jgi:hypothetical protein
MRRGRLLAVAAMVTPEDAREPMAIHGLNKDYGKSIRDDKGSNPWFYA